MTTAAQLRTAVERAGCRVCEVDELDLSGLRGELECADGWQAARLLLELAKLDAGETWANTVATRLRVATGATDADAYARAVFGLVQGAVRFEREKGEVFQSSRVTLESGVGDCDCHSRLVYALLAAGGVPARLGFLGRPGGNPRHVVAQAFTSRGWTWLETTVPGSRFGEHPIGAAVRVGAVRPDVSPGYAEVTTMGGPIGVEGGNVYRMRIASVEPRSYLPDRPELLVEQALLAAGFAEPTVWLEPRELPETWPAAMRAEVPDVAWSAWAEATFAAPVCLELGELDGNLRVEDAWIAPRDLEPVAALGAVVSEKPPAPPVVHTRGLGVSDAFFRELKVVAADLKTDPKYLLAIMLSESDLEPTAAYRVGDDKASGLIQNVFLKNVGFSGSHDDFIRLTALQQLPYIARYYRAHAGRGLTSAEKLYQINFMPASLERGSGVATVIAAADGNGYGTYVDAAGNRRPNEQRYYEINRGLDLDKDGKITVGDLKAKLQRVQMQRAAKWQEALARLAAAPDPTPPPYGAAAAIVIALGLAWLARS